MTEPEAFAEATRRYTLVAYAAALALVVAEVVP